ncbi:MAG: hypothetical protein R2874_10125 [Desulfobacterales bacterium]
MLQYLKQPLFNAVQVMRRTRYWLLKYLERQISAQGRGHWLDKRRDKYMILLTNYLIECKLESAAHWKPQTQDLVRVTIVHVDARRDVLSVDLG